MFPLVASHINAGCHTAIGLQQFHHWPCTLYVHVLTCDKVLHQLITRKLAAKCEWETTSHIYYYPKGNNVALRLKCTAVSSCGIQKASCANSAAVVHRHIVAISIGWAKSCALNRIIGERRQEGHIAFLDDQTSV